MYNMQVRGLAGFFLDITQLISFHLWECEINPYSREKLGIQVGTSVAFFWCPCHSDKSARVRSISVEPISVSLRFATCREEIIGNLRSRSIGNRRAQVDTEAFSPKHQAKEGTLLAKCSKSHHRWWSGLARRRAPVYCRQHTRKVFALDSPNPAGYPEVLEERVPSEIPMLLNWNRFLKWSLQSHD